MRGGADGRVQEPKGAKGAKGEIRKAINAARDPYGDSDAMGRALKVLWASRDPEAIAFLRTMVLNKVVHPEARLKHLIAVCVNGTERDRDFATTVAPKRTLLSPMMDRIAPGGNIEASGGYVRGTYEDAKTGKSWGLLSSFVLGGGLADLFVAEKEGGAWKDPAFLGIGIGTKTIGPESGFPAAFTGMTEIDFYGKKLWTGLIDAPVLRADADGDGLSDRLEARLGTDPGKKDSDGDGDDDLADPWPLVARRPATDEETALASAVGYCFYRDLPSFPIVWTNDLEPFELWGWPGLGFHGADAGKGFDRFGFMRLTFVPLPGEKGKAAADFVRWNADRSEATVTVRLELPGLVVDREFGLRKRGEAWLPFRYALTPR